MKRWPAWKRSWQARQPGPGPTSTGGLMPGTLTSIASGAGGGGGGGAAPAGGQAKGQTAG